MVGRPLTRRDLVAMLIRFEAGLGRAEATLNGLNVFPVADRDTGTNLLRTVGRLNEAVATAGLAAAGPAALRAARGNSGLIASQFLAAFLAPLTAGEVPIGPDRLAAAWRHGAVAARRAVSAPVDGTMLTVADAVADAVERADTATVAMAVDVAVAEAEASLARTTAQLDVLAAAGVVDAGAAGLVLHYRALRDVVDGAPATAAGRPAPDDTSGGSPAPHPEEHGLELDRPRPPRFELQFLLDGDDGVADGIRPVLAGHGVDVVVGSAGGVVSAHVHLDDVGPVLDAVAPWGRPRSISVDVLGPSVSPPAERNR